MKNGRLWLAAVAFGLLVLTGCNAVLGIEQAQSVAEGGCILNSDCEEASICVFRVCSPPCEKDRDCAVGDTCLNGIQGAACVRRNVNQCESAASCPQGTDCAQGECRARCGEAGALGCLDGQVCEDFRCRSFMRDGGLGAGSDSGMKQSGTRDGGTRDGGTPGGDTDGGLGDGSDSGVDGGAFDGAVPECQSGQLTCDENRVLACGDDGRYQPQKTCAYSCVAGECVGECAGAPNWSGGGTPVRTDRDDPRWAPAPVQTFANDVFGSLEGGHRVMYDPVAQQLIIALQMFSDPGGGPSQFDSVYLGVSTDPTGATAHGLRIDLSGPTGDADPKNLGAFVRYEYAGGAWMQPDGPFPQLEAPAWLAVHGAWTELGPEWAVHVKVDLAVLGLAPASGFRMALGMHASDDVTAAAVDLSTPDVGVAGAVADLLTMNPASWILAAVPDSGCAEGITLSSM